MARHRQHKVNPIRYYWGRGKLEKVVVIEWGLIIVTTCYLVLLLF